MIYLKFWEVYLRILGFIVRVGMFFGGRLGLIILLLCIGRIINGLSYLKRYGVMEIRV